MKCNTGILALAVLLGAACAGAVCFGGDAATVGLTVDHLVSPANIGAAPSFGWRMDSPRKGAAQVAYRIKVNVRAPDGPLVWDSGVVDCDKSVGIRYSGAPLKSAMKYAWSVAVKDEQGAWLKPVHGSFETGLINEGDWDGSVWISAADAKVSDYPSGKDVRDVKQEAEDGTACFLKTVANGKDVKEVWWTVAGLGVFEAYVNGEPVSRKGDDGTLARDFLKPGFTHNEKTKHSFTYDVTHLVKTGKGDANVFAAQVSAGWWRDKTVNFFGKKSAFRAQLVLRYADGTEERVGTDPSWLSATTGPVLRAAIFDGEDYDARISADWMTGKSCDGFRAAETNAEFKGELVPMVGAPVRLRRDLALAPAEMYVWKGAEGARDGEFGKVKRLRSYRDGDVVVVENGETLVVDFAQNAAAIPEFTFAADEGVTLTMRPAEMLNDGNGAKKRGCDGPEGSAYFTNYRQARTTLNYTFAGKGEETYHPNFTFFGYRYVSITATGRVEIKKIRSIPVTSIPQGSETGCLETGVADVNRLVSNIKWGQYSNYLSVPTDCPQRNERLGWMADTQVFAEAATYNADVYGFFLKWMRDVRDTQYKDGSYTGVAPAAQYGGDIHRIGWADAGIIVPYTIWKQYGDTRIVEECWESMKRFMKMLDDTKYASKIAMFRQYSDWLSCEKLEVTNDKAFEKGPDGKKRPTADALKYWRYLGGCYWLWDARMMATMADAIGRDEDAAAYRDMAERARAYMVGEFVDAKDGMLLPLFRDMQTPALFALKLGIIERPDALVQTKAALLKNFKDHGNCLQTGFLGTSILMDTVTYDAGSPEMAYTLLLQHKNPSWLYSVDQGATTVWERWNSYTRKDGFGPDDMNSFNHYAYGSVLAWMYGTMAGIQEDAARPGFKHIVLAPMPDRRMGHVKASFRSPYGFIKSAWRYDEAGNWTWAFTIPANTTATVKVPGGEVKEYASGTYTVSRAASAAGDDLTRYVLPLMGSDSTYEFSTGNTYPAVGRPNGMHLWTLQTGKNGSGWIYGYRDRKVRGIRQTHAPSPWINDHCAWSFMPLTRDAVGEEARASWFTHKAEEIEPQRMKVYLADDDTTVELTATERAALAHIVYPETDTPYLVVDALGRGGRVEVDTAQRRITGKSGFAAFIMEFDRDFTLVDGEGDAVLRIKFAPTKRGDTVSVKIASSFISLEQANRNLGELGDGVFASIVEEGRVAWNERLGRIRVEGPLDDMRKFYTCLYRTQLFPLSVHEYDADGKPVHRNPETGRVEKGVYYAGTGFWDTFRALFPLLNLVYPDVNAKMTEGLCNCWRECGWLPEWSSPGIVNCMIGNNSASVVAEACLTPGVVSRETAEVLYRALLHGANSVKENNESCGRAGWELYNRLGYVPRDAGIKYSAARTLEYAYDDWCIWRLGVALGRTEEETDVYLKRSGNWRNVFDEKSGLMCGRAADGTFDANFDPFEWGVDFVEGCSWHYTWSVFHDIAGLAEAMGGKNALAKKLDEVFELPPVFRGYGGKTIHEMREMQVANFGQYAHGNQPIQHMIYLYDWTDEPHKTQYWVREAMDRLYKPAPDGYCGDEDNGQTSAWFVWSALGMYPVCPASGEYALGAPLFERATVSLPGERTLAVSAPGVSAKRRYAKRVALGGKAVSGNFVKAADLRKGGELVFEMSDSESAAVPAPDGEVAIDFAKERGAIKPLHGVNNAPVRTTKKQKEFKEAGIPFVRTHDTYGLYGGTHYVDIPNVFRDFDADENDPANYDFALTDAYLKQLVEAGCKIFYRLGVTIENNYKIKAYDIYPPKDYAKWARICEHVVRHYNEGWANGFKWGIEYWEIWNEPENPPMWQGTREQFFEFYRVAANHLKKTFPSIKVGGYAGCGFYAVDDEQKRKHDKFFSGFITWFEDFCRYVQAPETKAPLDFFSWHLYVSQEWPVDRIATHAAYVRRTLDAAGLSATENIFNEWNVFRGSQKDQWDTAKSHVGAANVAAAFCLMQESSIDKAMYYDACPTRGYCGLFYYPSVRTTPCYEAFRAWNELAKLGTSVECAVSGQDVYAAAAKGADGCAYLVANTGRDVVRVKVSCEGRGPFTLYRVDGGHASLAPVGECRDGDVLEIPGCGFVLALDGVVMEVPASASSTSSRPVNGLQQ